MKDNYKNKILVLTILTIVFTIMGSTLAFWNWNTSEAERTLIGFTVEQNLSCTGDGGGNITSSEKKIVPTSCTNQEYAIQRTITLNTSSTISTNDIFLDLWLDVIDIGKGLSSSKNFKYALTKNPNDCTTNAITGSFYRIGNGGRIKLLKNKEYIGTNQDTYYLYIWLDAAEENPNTMNQSFELKLGGSCQDDPPPAPSAPILDKTGMIPVTIDNSGNVTTVSENDSNWYDYNNKKWANAVLVTESSRANYLNKPNIPVTKSDILAYYVWIPRYKYMIPESTIYKTCLEAGDDLGDNFVPECHEILLDETKKEELIYLLYQALQEEYPSYSLSELTKDVNNSLESGIWNSNTLIESDNAPMIMMLAESGIFTEEELSIIITEGLIFHGERITNQLVVPEIDIIFETSSNEKSIGNAVDSYLTHPAFGFNEGMTGFWVGKFETTGTAEQPTILNGMQPLVSQDISEQFTSSLLFANGTFNDRNRTITFANSPTYGLSNTTDSHMMKNSEWGAVAYLSRSKYGTCTDGVCQEIRYNNYTTEDGEYTQTGCGPSSNCSDGFGSDINEYPQSTTGNISGVFDMAGGTGEYVMGNYSNTKGSYWSYTNLPPTKYYDLYTFDNITSCTTETCGGHALNETYGWYNDIEDSDFVNFSNPWFLRGTHHYALNNGGGAVFQHSSYTGGSYGFFSWRSVLVVD